jgi:glycosyltransferase involved in cell wall biosynthesis
MNRSIYFVSANDIWGGSEVLWTLCATQLIDKGHAIRIAVKYEHDTIENLKTKGASCVQMKWVAPPLTHRLLRKLKLIERKEPFLKSVSEQRPSLVVLSQGNNVHGNYYMKVCRELSIPFITITQLVTEIFWAFMDDKMIDELRVNYAASRMNYFVSEQNLEMHTIMLGDAQPNCKVINNPITVASPASCPFPPNDVYRIALVGRLDTYHKGHDLLLRVLSQERWKNRPVKFRVYGAGPHQKLLERLIKRYGIQNVQLSGHVLSTSEIWTENHLLILPSRMEGQSLALLEAMWCNRAAIVTDVGGARDLIMEGETGFLAEATTVTQLDAALERAWSNRDNWEMMGKKAGEKIRKTHGITASTSLLDEIQNIAGVR